MSEPKQLDLVAAVDEAEGLDPWVRELPVEWLLESMSARVGERVRVVVLDDSERAGVEFLHLPSEPGQSRVEMIARRPALLVTVDLNGVVDVHVAADTTAEADAFVDVLRARDDIGEAVRLLVERGTEPEREGAA
jgi:hypothetical protein